MTKRWIFGKRGSDYGLWISEPDYDVDAATMDELMLVISMATPQVAIRGVATGPFPQNVPHTLGYSPIVIPSLFATRLTGTFGFTRPFDCLWGPWTYSEIEAQTSQLVVKQSKVGGSPPDLDVGYVCYNRAAP